MKLLEWFEQLPAPLTAFVSVILSVGGLFLAIIGGDVGAAGAVIAYTAGWLSRHLALPRAHPYLEEGKHGKSYFHEEVKPSE